MVQLLMLKEKYIQPHLWNSVKQSGEGAIQSNSIQNGKGIKNYPTHKHCFLRRGKNWSSECWTHLPLPSDKAIPRFLEDQFPHYTGLLLS